MSVKLTNVQCHLLEYHSATLRNSECHVCTYGACADSNHEKMMYSELSGLQVLESWLWRWRRTLWDFQYRKHKQWRRKGLETTCAQYIYASFTES